MSCRRGRFVTLENFILDTFTRIDEDDTEHRMDRPDEIGGAGTYTLIGARIFQSASELGMIIDYTPETLPRQVRAKLAHYGNDAFVFRLRDDGEPTLRAVNRYKGQLRIFEYLTTPLFLTPKSWAGTAFADPPPLVVHFVPMPERLVQVVTELDDMREAITGKWDPIVLWEPDIPMCDPAHLALCRQVTRRTHVISPNHSEALSLLSMRPIFEVEPSLIKARLAEACVELARLCPRLAAIIRCGHLGCCYVSTTGATEPRAEDVRWVPAYWEVDGSLDKVVDPTGAGNAFMGGLGAALQLGKDMDEAVLWATVAASFVIEQHGLPRLDATSSGEMWNGEKPLDRVAQLWDRMKSA